MCSLRTRIGIRWLQVRFQRSIVEFRCSGPAGNKESLPETVYALEEKLAAGPHWKLIGEEAQQSTRGIVTSLVANYDTSRSWGRACNTAPRKCAAITSTMRLNDRAIGSMPPNSSICTMRL